MMMVFLFVRRIYVTASGYPLRLMQAWREFARFTRLVLFSRVVTFIAGCLFFFCNYLINDFSGNLITKFINECTQ